MHIKWKLLCLLLALTVNIEAQMKSIDTVAVYILDHMSDVIGELSSCSYDLYTSIDVNEFEHGLVKYFGSSEVHMVGPDKMLVQSHGHRGHRGFWYNGVTFTYYSYTENNFGVVSAPSNIIATIDSLHEHYDFDFPAADFFYPTFTDDILDNFESLSFLGSKQVDGENCFHILASNDKMTAQIWVADDAFNLPVKFVLTYKDQNPSRQYEATFSNWKVNPDLPDAMFNFVPPNGAAEITILSKKDVKP